MLVACLNGAKPLTNGARAGHERRFYRPELDAVRFFAFLAVFLFHASLFATKLTSKQHVFAYSGKFGTCLFFVLSSYLITELLLRENRQTGTVRIGSFYLRRILRIWPLYFGFIALCTVIGMFHPTWRMSGSAIAAFSLLAGNWYVVQGGQPSPLAAPLWSISLEEQFYLLWPIMAQLGGRRALIATGVALLPASAVAAVCFPENSWFNSFVQFQFFAIGALVALMLNGRAPHSGAPLRIGLFSVGVAMWVGGGYFASARENGLVCWPFVAAGCVCFMLAALGAPATWFPRGLLKLGRVSYGLYVFHMFSLQICHAAVKRMDLITLLAAFTISLVCALTSHRWLEAPFLRWKDRFSYVLSRPNDYPASTITGSLMPTRNTEARVA